MQITDTMLGKCFDIASDKTNGTRTNRYLLQDTQTIIKQFISHLHTSSC